MKEHYAPCVSAHGRLEWGQDVSDLAARLMRERCPSPKIGDDMVGALPPTWLDAVIEKEIDKGDPKAIAQAIANSPQFLKGIENGLAQKPKPGVMGPSYAQNVRRAVIDALSATS